MLATLTRLSIALTLALGVAAGAHAQSKRGDSTVVPVWNQASGKLEAVLLLEPAQSRAASGKWRLGNQTLEANFGLDAGESLGLVCDRKTGLTRTIGNLIDHCLVAALDQDNRGRSGSAGASLSRPAGKLGLSVGNNREVLPSWLSPAGRPSRLDENSLTVYGQKNIGREATVSIGGTWARARLIPAADMPASVTDRWNSQSFGVGAGLGAFGANIVGRVVDTPAESGQWSGIDLGFTWRTPWSGQLSVGAENVVTRGKNPFAPVGGDEEGTVPYVRYEQDL